MLEIGNGLDDIISINFDLVMGDRSGFIHLQAGQAGFIEYSEFSLLRSMPPVNFIIKNGAQIWLSADFKVIGEDTYAFWVKLFSLAWQSILYFDCPLTLSQMTNFRLFQTERVCRRQFQIC